MTNESLITEIFEQFGLANLVGKEIDLTDRGAKIVVGYYTERRIWRSYDTRYELSVTGLGLVLALVCFHCIDSDEVDLLLDIFTFAVSDVEGRVWGPDNNCGAGFLAKMQAHITPLLMYQEKLTSKLSDPCDRVMVDVVLWYLENSESRRIAALGLQEGSPSR